MSYKGRYQPNNPLKYKGNFRNIIYRSLWELKFMKYCDSNQNILEWGSEEVFLPYRSPLDNKIHRYFPDFYIKYIKSNGSICRSIIEVKPDRQTKPPKKPKRQTKGYLYEVTQYVTNEAKWEAAKEFCKDRLWEFRIFTEKELGIK